MNFYFKVNKSAAEGHPLLAEVYGEPTPSDKSCGQWFWHFKSDVFGEDKELSNSKAGCCAMSC